MEFTQQKRGELSHEIRIMDIHRSGDTQKTQLSGLPGGQQWPTSVHPTVLQRDFGHWLWSLCEDVFATKTRGKKDGISSNIIKYHQIWSNMIKYDENDQKESMFILQNQKTWCSGALSPGNFRDPDVAMILLLKDSLPRWICFWAIFIDIQSVPHHCWICPIY